MAAEPVTRNGATPRDAATVVLLADSGSGLVAWLMRRVSSLVFAPNMTVFPGGGVDPTDHTGAEVVTAASVAARFDISTDHASTILRAAVREIAEEADVVLDPADLMPWTRWITPATEPRRYDTYFFVAAMPIDALARNVTSESVDAGWLGIGAALAEFEAGSRPMMPPTVVTMRELAEFSEVGQVLAAAAGRRISVVRPHFLRRIGTNVVVDVGDGTLVELPESYLTALEGNP